MVQNSFEPHEVHDHHDHSVGGPRAVKRYQKMAGLVAKLYHNVFRRTSSFVLAAVFGAFMFERGFDLLSEGIYDTVNQGVSRSVCGSHQLTDPVMTQWDLLRSSLFSVPCGHHY